MYKFLFLFFLCFLFSAFSRHAIADAEANPALVQELSSRHPSYTVGNLVEIVGNEDDLVSQLLSLRLRGKPSNTAINAQKVLLSFSHRQDVKEALLEDVSLEDRFGLGSVVLSRVDEIEDPEFRLSLAKTALQASNRFENIRSSRYKMLLLDSRDSKVKSLLR
jgi:hypothetical protein